MTGGRTCQFETAVRELARTGAADDAVRDHVTRCETCRETLTVARFMHELAGAPGGAPRLADPGLLWWKAQLLQRWDAQRRAAAPLDQGQDVQVGVGLAGAVVLAAWLWPTLRSWGAEAVSPSALSTWASQVPHAIITMVAIGGLLLAATAIVAVRGLFTD